MLVGTVSADAEVGRDYRCATAKGRQHRLARLKPILACPACLGQLDFQTDKAICRICAADYRIANGKIYFIDVPARVDDLDGIKAVIKKYLGKYYYKIGINIIAPTYPFNYRKKILGYLDPARQMVVDVGCGNHRIDENIIGVDIFDYDAADIVCDIDSLPFKPDSVDAFVSRSVLEHIPNPSRVVEQFHRCTKEDGLSIHLIPFLYPYHASPWDFQRYTHAGQATLFRSWKIVEQTNPTGPVTLGLICLIEFLSILISFGRNRLKAYIYLLLCGLLFPLKFLDCFFVNRKAFLPLAPSIFMVARKSNG